MAEEAKKQENDSIYRTFELLSRAAQGRDIVVRDDQYQPFQLLDGVKLCRKRGNRMRIIDSGTLDQFVLEWLGSFGADIYFSTESRGNVQELEFINLACQRGGATLGMFHQGTKEKKEEKGEERKEEEQERLSFTDLLNLGRKGVYVYLVSKEEEKDFVRIIQLAHQCSRGGSWMVYYHQGSLDSNLIEIAKHKAWIHVTDLVMEEDDDYFLLLDITKAAHSSGSGLILHPEKGLDFTKLLDLSKAGGYIILNPSDVDFRYPFTKIEKLNRKKRMDYKSYYLYLSFFPHYL